MHHPFELNLCDLKSIHLVDLEIEEITDEDLSGGSFTSFALNEEGGKPIVTKMYGEGGESCEPVITWGCGENGNSNPLTALIGEQGGGY